MTPPRIVPFRLLLASLAALAITVTAGPAVAEEPVNVSGPITDPSGALGNRTGEVRSALDDLFDSSGQQLFVVYVDSFDGLDGQTWADRSAATSDLGADDILLAVATEDRAYGFSVDEDSKLSDGDLRKIEDEDLLPELRDEDWAGAAIAAAQGYDRALNPGVPWGPIGLGGAVVAGGGLWAGGRWVSRRRANRPDADLDKRSGSALVAVDDALRSAEAELSYAEAQFGKEATLRFTQALAEARTKATEAFTLRQQLDDSQPEPGPERDRLATQIIDLCGQADALLDEQVEAFAQLRDLQAKAPEVLAALAERAGELQARIPASRATLEALQAKHPADDLVSISGNVALAEQLAAEALRQTELGQTAVTAEDRATAVVHSRTAEDALSRAALALDALNTADADLAAAPGLIAERLASLSADLQDITTLSIDTSGAIGPAVTTAQDAIAAAGRPDHDPLGTVRSLQTAEAALDELLAAPRAEAEKVEKARAALTGALSSTRSRRTAIDEYITSRRGVIGTDARTRLSEADRQIQIAADLQTTDPSAALSALASADDLLQQADRAAQRDVRQSEERFDSGGVGGSGMFGGMFGSGGGGSSWGGGWSGSSTRSRSRSSSSRRSSSRRSSSRRSSSRSSGRRGGGGRF